MRFSPPVIDGPYPDYFNDEALNNDRPCGSIKHQQAGYSMRSPEATASFGIEIPFHHRRRCQTHYSQHRKHRERFPPTRRRVAKAHQTDLKPLPRAKISKRPKVPRTVCNEPGCGESVARAVDLKRHKKAAHAGNEWKFQCLLCKDGLSQDKKSKGDWMFPMKYNLLE